MHPNRRFQSPVERLMAIASIACLLSLPACDNSTGTNGGGGGGGSNNDNVLIDAAINFNGTVNGKVATQQSTRASLDSQSSGQDVPPDIDTDDTVVKFRDVAGNELRDAQGEPIPDVPLESDGTFSADQLPVGTDFTVCVDEHNDGTCEEESCIQIPADPTGLTGELNNVQPDPLTTLVLAKLRELMTERGVDPKNLPFSPAALVSRIVTAYVNLYEESGVEQTITIDDIENLTSDQLAELFDSIIPPNVRSGLRMAEGNLDASRAEGVDELVLAVAKVFLQAGFPIMDSPDGVDLSALAGVDDVETTTMEELFGRGPDGTGGPPPGEFTAMIDPSLLPQEVIDFLQPELLAEFSEGIPVDVLLNLPPDIVALIPEDLLAPPPAQDVGAGEFPQPTIYRLTIAEPDRNFASAEGGEQEDAAEGDGLPPLPVLNDHVIAEMAALHLEGRRISLGALLELLGSFDDGLGARLTYFVFDPNFFGPPLRVFETADGNGKAISESDLFGAFAAGGFENLGPEGFAEREAALRDVLSDLLAGTSAPNWAALLDVLLSQRLASVDELAQKLRDARAHLPFSLSGPSTFFVVADGDAFRGDATASPVTVDADIDVDGAVLRVTYNPTGSGRFFLGFTEGTDREGFVQLINRETGKFLHNRRDKARISVFDNDIFEPIDGSDFSAFVTETGSFFPGVNVPVIRADFTPDQPPPPPPTDATAGGDTVTPASHETSGPNQQLFVLATALGEGAEPVRVDYDRSIGVATYNAAGRNLLMFLPDSHTTGVFGLFNEDTGREARLDDPADFFVGPVEKPENFEDIFNEQGGDFGDFDGIEDILDPNNPPPPPADDPLNPAEFGGQVNEFGQIVVDVDSISGLPLGKEAFTRVFGVEAPNEKYDASRDPYFDDADNDGVHDDGEVTAQFRPTLFDPNDWRSTDVRLYYRRVDNGQSVTFDQIAFDSATPKTLDGVDLVARNFKTRLNAFRYGRPNTAVNLLTAFAPPDFFDGTRTLDESTELDIFSAVAFVNLVMDQVFNVDADIDPDGVGPAAQARTLVDAHIFVAPISDPFLLLVKGFKARSVVSSEAD